MADFERQQFEIGLEFVHRSSAECIIFSEGSSEPTKDTQVIRVRGAAAPRVFELELLVMLKKLQTSNSSSKTRGAAAPHTRITCTSFLGLEEPSLKLLRSSELQRTNSSPISNCRRSKSAIFISRNINYNINSLLLLRVGIRIIYIYIYRTSVTYWKSK